MGNSCSGSERWTQVYILVITNYDPCILLKPYLHVYKKTVLLFSGSSEYRHRPYISACVKTNMGADMIIHAAEHGQSARLTQADFMRGIMGAYAVLQPPGRGYDCYRLWETLLSGSMPVLERNTGLDRYTSKIHNCILPYILSFPLGLCISCLHCWLMTSLLLLLTCLDRRM